MQAVIMAGGKGTRLKSITDDIIPKPMVRLLGKPILEYQIESMARSGIKEIYLVVGHLAESIQLYFKDGLKWGVSIHYVVENEPLGTAGALSLLRQKISNDFILVFGDLLLDIDFSRFMQFHLECAGAASLFVHPNSHPYDSDIVVVDDKNRVTGSLPKAMERRGYYRNLVNAGVYALSPQILDYIEDGVKQDMEKDVLFPLIQERKNIYAYHSPEYVKDIGTPERLQRAEQELHKGIVTDRNLKFKQKCVFLDRDGTINVYKGLIASCDELELEDKAAEAIRLLNESGYLVIIITNQPVVARGMCSTEDVKAMHRKLETMLGDEGAYVDDILFCPHHPDKGYPEENPVYKKVCHCRKPDIGLIGECVRRYNIVPEKSWMIGDSTVDMKTAENAGLRKILVKTGIAGTDAKYETKADYVFDNLFEAAKKIVAE